ncbi:MAG: rhomboid family protein [Deltaproteobacteria bacterium]|nr:rhomboid family protein [Deltaproteobacteria bacterium]
MTQFSRLRCFHHPSREAAARCLECHRNFCRECVTEHEGRLLCATCLDKRLKPKRERSRRWGAAIRIIHLLLGLWLAGTFFYYTGQALMQIPESFHEGTIWNMDM